MAQFDISLKELEFPEEVTDPLKAAAFCKKWDIPFGDGGDNFLYAHPDDVEINGEIVDDTTKVSLLSINDLPENEEVFYGNYNAENSFRRFMNNGIVETYINHSSEEEDNIKELPFSFGGGEYPTEYYKELKEILDGEFSFGLHIDIGHGYYDCYADLTEDGLEWSIDYYLP